MGSARYLDKASFVLVLAGCVTSHKVTNLSITMAVAMAANNPVEIEGRYRGRPVRFRGEVENIGYVTKEELVTTSSSFGVANKIGNSAVASGGTQTKSENRETRFAYVQITEPDGHGGGSVACLFDPEDESELTGVSRGDLITVNGLMKRADAAMKPEIVLTRCTKEINHSVE